VRATAQATSFFIGSPLVLSNIGSIGRPSSTTRPT
jgi:hypothetical protein